MEYILAFGSAHRALKAESVLRKGGHVFRLLPAPRAFTLHCDLVISVPGDGLDEAVSTLKDAGLEPGHIFRKEGEDYVEV